jgi:hypothetical protein
LQQGGIYYPVVGALTNIGVVTAKADGADPDVIKWADYSAQTATAINTIGSDWKTFDNTTFKYTMTPDRSYFVKTKAGLIYKMKFTGFAGSSTGQINFSIEDLANGIVSPSSNINGIALYPNPVNESSKVVAHFNSSVQNLQIEILDLNGKVCGTIYQNVQAGLQTLDIPSTQLASGFYFLRMSSGADQALVKFLIP